MRVAGHCVRHGEEEEASKLVLCQPNTDKLREERTHLLEDTGFDSIGELRTPMLNQCVTGEGESNCCPSFRSDQTNLYSFSNGNLLLEKMFLT